MMDKEHLIAELEKKLEHLQRLREPEAEELAADLDALKEWDGKNDPPLDLSMWDLESDEADESNKSDEEAQGDEQAAVEEAPSPSVEKGKKANKPADEEAEDQDGDPDTELKPTNKEEQAAKVSGELQPESGIPNAPEEESQQKQSEESTAEKSPPVQELTIEQQQFNRQLETARELFENQQLSDLLSGRQLCLRLVDDDHVLEVQREKAEKLMGQFQRALNQMLDEALQEGDQQRQEKNTEKARQAYNQALRIDPLNSHAEDGLRSLDEEAATEQTREEMIKLRAGLRNQEDLEILESAVRRAEALLAQDKLPEDLHSYAEEGRAYFDEQRKFMGEATTQSRFGKLSETKKALDKVRQAQRERKTKWKDEATGEWIDISAAIDNFNQQWKRKSDETAAYVLAKIDNQLPARPYIAQDIYDNAWKEPDPSDPDQMIPVPYQEHAEQMLQKKKDEINEHLRSMEQAEKMEGEADQEKDPVDRYKALKHAYQVFPHLGALKNKITEARRESIRSLETRIDNQFQSAESELALFNFDQAREQVEKVRELKNSWPDEEIPASFEKADQKAQEFFREIAAQEKALEDFNQTLKEILEARKDPESLQRAFSLLENLQEDERFQEYQALDHLNAEMDAYRGIEDLLQEAQLALDDGRWDRVYQISQESLRGDVSGKVRQQFLEFRAEADQERKISQINDWIHEDRFQKADALVKKLLEADEKLKERLSDPIKAIARAKQAVDKKQDKEQLSLGEIFERALPEAKSNAWEQNFKALERYRYLGGEIIKPLEDEDWAPYQPSIYTAPARDKVHELAQQLRETILQPLMAAYHNREEKTPTEADMIRYQQQAQKLRNAQLLNDDEEERGPVRWAEIEQGIRSAKNAEKHGNWQRSVELWRSLDIIYPQRNRIRNGLRNAKIELALIETDQFLEKDETKNARERVYQALDDPFLGRSWKLQLKLAEVHQARGDFQKAVRLLKELLQNKECADLAQKNLQEYQADQQIHKMDQEVEGYLSKGKAELALEVLLDGVDSGEDEETRAYFQDRMDEIFSAESAALLERSKLELEKNTNEGRIGAMVALIDLLSIEELLEIPEDKRSALPEIEMMSDEMEGITKSIVKKAQQNNFQNRKLSDVLFETKQIASRLRTLKEVLRHDSDKYEDELKRINNVWDHITRRLERLQNMVGILEDVQQRELWEQCLRRDDFSPLNVDKRLQSLDLPGLLEPQQYLKKLAEWKDINRYISQKIQDLRRAFMEEKFIQVQKIISTVKVLPVEMSDGRQFSQIQQREYEAILEILNEKLIIINLYGPEIKGWEDANQEAKDRQKELTQWQAWGKQVAKMGQRSFELRQEAMDQQVETKLGQLKEKWVAVEKAAQQTLQLILDKPETDEGEVLKRRSRMAEELYKEGNNSQESIEAIHDQAQEKINDLNDQIEKLGGFPGIPELDELKKLNALDQLEKRIQAGERIGPTSSEEEKRLNIYRGVLKRLREDSQTHGDRFMGRIKNLLGM